MIFTGAEIVAELLSMGVSDVVWLPDSELGQWEAAIDASPIRLLRVCREGEAWPLAAGLTIGGRSPLIAIQTTGLFESGDALRHVVYDLELPLFAIIGARNWLHRDSSDSARRFAEPALQTWEIDFEIIDSREQRPRLQQLYRRCQSADRAGAILLAE